MSDWTIMIKDSKGSADGWYWAELWVGMTLDNHDFPFSYPNAGFGIYCTRCHASAEKEGAFDSSRGAAKECSPGRQPWGQSARAKSAAERRKKHFAQDSLSPLRG